MSPDDLHLRWRLPGAPDRERLLACWRAGLPWRDRPLWPGEAGDSRPDLRGMYLREERLAGVDLSDCRLDDANFDFADVSGARFRRSSLSGARFGRVIAAGLDAFAADLHGAQFGPSTFARATLAAANLAATSWWKVSLREADLRGATLNGATLIGCSFEGVRLDGADLDGALIVGGRGLPRNRHDVDEWDALSPALAPLLRTYPRLMHELSRRSHKLAEDCLLGSGRPAAEVPGLLLDDNWRVALGGVAAAIALGPEPRVVHALWLALERGSWVAPQLAVAASLLDPEFEERARAFIAPASTSFPSLASEAPQKPAKSLVSVAVALDPAGALPAWVAALPEAESTRKVTLGWRERSKWVEGKVHARRIGQAMAASMKEAQADPEEYWRREVQEEIEKSEIARRVMAEFGRGTQLFRGRYADVTVTDEAGEPRVTKEAHAIDASAPRGPLAECEAVFTTGIVVFGDPDPNEVVRCEAEALTALAPATPPVIESGVRSDGRAYVVRAFVRGETWRTVLQHGEKIDRASLRKLVQALASVEESSALGFHGDVKPDNVIKTPAGEVVLIDPTAAYMRRIANGPLERALLTGEYNPRLLPSDHAALALTLIEMLTGCQLIADAAERAATRPIGSRLRASLQFAASTGSDLFARRLPAIRLPSELSPALAGPPEIVLLRALGLSWRDGVLDAGEPLARIRELSAVLEGR